MRRNVGLCMHGHKYMYTEPTHEHCEGTDVGIKLLPAVGVSLFSKTHSLFMYKDGWDQISTSCGCVSAFQDTFTVHVAQ